MKGTNRRSWYVLIANESSFFVELNGLFIFFSSLKNNGDFCSNTVKNKKIHIFYFIFTRKEIIIGHIGPKTIPGVSRKEVTKI